MTTPVRGGRKVKITVGMPVYNARPSVASAIESVLAQDHPSFELVIVDDASTDGSGEVLRKYRGHPRVRIYANARRLGRGGTRNRILRLARGRYVTPCDADDRMLKGNLRKLSAYLDRHPAVGAAYGDMRVHEFDGKGRLIRKHTLARDCEKTWDLLENVINHAGSMIRLSFLRKIGGYDENVRYADDWSMWLKLSEVAPIKYLGGPPLYLWKRQMTRAKSRIVTHGVARIRREAIARRYGFGRKAGA
ncbi:MAG TPA: glycosyltransferase family A protein [Candidatus Eisenbacteria bacterium]|nr:glycosyltransferase family A protein [Candidatus Eisenbacteria bacterium]